MEFKKELWPILIFNALYLIPFLIYYLAKQNWEFVAYVGVMIVIALLILFSYNKVKYSNFVLWAMSIWGFFHMAGGGFFYEGVRWYSQILVPIVGEPYNILKYDQAIHAYGFFVATILAYEVIKTRLKAKYVGGFGLGMVLAMAGLGFGAVNEIVEFGITVVVPETGVGGYMNTSLDLVFNFIGSITAVFVIIWRERKS